MKRTLKFVGCLSAFLFTACVPAVVPNPFKVEDITPPAVLSWEMETTTSIVIVFSESVCIDGHTYSIQPTDTPQADGSEIMVCTPEAITNSSGETSQLRCEIAKPCQAGTQYLFTGTVHDTHGNSLAFTLPFWGFNPNIPVLLLSELLTEGSQTHPDILELYVSQPGNLAGITVFIGAPGTYSFRYVFPPCEVLAGDFILLHLKPQGIPEEIDELHALTVSGGLDASPLARDFWCKKESGSLSGKNGAISVYSNPGGFCIDAVIYSERTSASDTNYRGFGSASLLAMVMELCNASAWIVPEGIKPESAAQSTGTTSTRTICRWSDERDTNQNSDWHIVPTRGSTLGTKNKDDVYTPSTKAKK